MGGKVTDGSARGRPEEKSGYWIDLRPSSRPPFTKVDYSTFSSARRFIARPSGLSRPFLVLSAIGSLSPLPSVVRRLAAMPLDTRYAFTACARRSERRWLYESDPIESV